MLRDSQSTRLQARVIQEDVRSPPGGIQGPPRVTGKDEGSQVAFIARAHVHGSSLRVPEDLQAGLPQAARIQALPEEEWRSITSP